MISGEIYLNARMQIANMDSNLKITGVFCRFKVAVAIKPITRPRV